MPREREDRQPTRRSLLSRLRKSDDPASWEEFVSIYRGMIWNAAVEAGLPNHEAEDVAQDTLLALWKQIRLRQFKYDPSIGSFRGFLKRTARWRIHDHYRKRVRQPKPAEGLEEGRAGSTAVIDTIPDPATLDRELVSDAEWQQTLLNAAIERVKRQVAPKQFQIFDAYVLKNWPVEKIVASLEVSRTQVYLAKLRISKLIRREVRQLETRGV